MSMPQEFYQITVKGHLNPNWADWFDGLTITPLPNGTTVISGPVVDQTALHGVLRKVRDLGVPITLGHLHQTRPGRCVRGQRLS